MAASVHLSVVRTVHTVRTTVDLHASSINDRATNNATRCFLKSLQWSARRSLKSAVARRVTTALNPLLPSTISRPPPMFSIRTTT